jgi:hypothetical protein
MAWYTIHHSCEHQSERQIYGTNTHGEREREAAHYGRRRCPDCIRAARDEESTQAAAYADIAGWPALQGSERQVQWAQTLRAKALDELDNACRVAGVAEHDHDELRAVLLGQRRARQWIEYRGGNPRGNQMMNLVNMTTFTPLPGLLAAWRSDPDKGVVDRFLDAHKDKP